MIHKPDPNTIIPQNSHLINIYLSIIIAFMNASKARPQPAALSAKGPPPAVSGDGELDKQVAMFLKKKERRRKLITLALALASAGCFLWFGLYNYHSGRTASNTSGLAQLIGDSTFVRINDGPQTFVHRTAEGDMPPILDEYLTVYNKNKRLIGWIKIEDTNIDYPVMQTVNNEYYLDRNFSQEYDRNGSIFMDYQCKVHPRSDNLIIYGHHMKSGAMFGNLQKYESEAFFQEHPLIQFDTIYEKGTYQVMYAFRSRVFREDEIVFKYYQFIDVNSADEFNSNMREMAALSYYDTGVSATYGDAILTLSTCDDEDELGRFVVVAKKVR